MFSISRYNELLEELSHLSEWELRSFCLDEASTKIISEILAYKKKKNEINLSEISYDEQIKVELTIKITTDRAMVEEYGSIESMVSAGLDGSDFHVDNIQLDRVFCDKAPN